MLRHSYPTKIRSIYSAKQNERTNFSIFETVKTNSTQLSNTIAPKVTYSPYNVQKVNCSYSFLHKTKMNGKREGLKTSDIATLGTLCVDVVLNVPELPLLNNTEERKAYTEQLDASSPDKKFWEAGGNCNLDIAASRLGLRVNAVGHVGNDSFGHFLLDVLKDEAINLIRTNENSEDEKGTTICWVLVDPFQNHDFFSRSDYNTEPSLNRVTKLPESAKMAIEQSKILFFDGYVFNELRAELITSTLHCAIDAGTTIFFDPGPNITSIFNGPQEKRKLLELSLNLSDVLLATSDEIELLTGMKDPIQAGQELIIKKGNRMKWVVIKMGSQGSVLITRSSIYCAPAFKVDVVDTVGCGDSYTAAIAFGYVHELPLIDTITLANAVGAATAMGNGAGRNVATLDKVVELLAQSNIVENFEYWSSLFGENLEAVNEVLLLCRTCQNGCSDRFVHVPAESVASELIRNLNLVKD